MADDAFEGTALVALELRGFPRSLGLPGKSILRSSRTLLV
ncbi:hypothetical protein OU5_P0128 (plasmid) [Pseudomonas mandelii JR-1]|uniref:Uncharacterized protein n=1 Tax=Pseudomonas mandelii JR-1 TaxID=1147786 RepID=A0A024ELB6_9PSED|nr:hypothetical protein OU5_P0128 [Pseudomonas mandelii JR-1]